MKSRSVMQKWQIRPSLISPTSRCRNVCRTFHSKSQLFASEQPTAPPTSPPPSPNPTRSSTPSQPRQSTRRGASAKASRDLQGLRGLAPGGFAPPFQKPVRQFMRDNDRGQDTSSRPLKIRTDSSGESDTSANPTSTGAQGDSPADRFTGVSRQQNDSIRTDDRGPLKIRTVSYGESDTPANPRSRGARRDAPTFRPAVVSRPRNDGNRTNRRPAKFDGRRHDFSDDGDEEDEEGEEEEDEETEESVSTPHEEFELLQSIEEHLAKPLRRFKPDMLTADDLVINRVATIAGPMGPVSEIDDATAKLARRNDTRWSDDAALARRLMAGHLVKFGNGKEKQRVVALAEEMAGETANKIQRRVGGFVEKKGVGFVPVSNTARHSLVNQVARGQYEEPVSSEEGDIKERTMRNLARSVALNSTYSPTQGKSMLDFIEKLWPGGQQGPRSKP